ncbi:MAG: class I SAM-dependent methyltransferase, partial [Actinomycetota bacterium]|nr:class I SAM-dependent methyltransferase [Actinomycetota bacterium]
MPQPLYLQRDQPPGVPPLALTGERTLPDVPEENYWFRRHLVVYEWIARRVAGQAVVDMACGEGYGADVLARRARSVVGVDANPEAHEHAR